MNLWKTQSVHNEYTGLAKKLVWVLPQDVTEKPKQSFGATQIYVNFGLKKYIKMIFECSHPCFYVQIFTHKCY